MHLKWDRGFTLVEILASIVILTIVLTVFMKFFAQATIFANKNEEMLIASNDAREVLSLVQENPRVLDILIDNGYVDMNSKDVINTDPISDTTILEDIFNPRILDIHSSLGNLNIDNVQLNVTDAPNNLISLNVNVLNSDSEVVSQTYGYIPKRINAPVFNLRALPTSTDDGVINLWTSQNTTDIFLNPESYEIALHMKNSNSNPFGDEFDEGDLSFTNVNQNIDEYIIETSLEFISPASDGGFGFLVDGTVTEPSGLNKATTKFMNENGYMITFNRESNSIELTIRQDGKDKYPGAPTESFEIVNSNPELIVTNKPSDNWTFNWNAKTNVKIEANNAFSTGVVSDPLSTRRTYKVIVSQNDLTFSAFFDSSLIDLKLLKTDVPEYDLYSKNIGIRLWSDSSTNLNELKIYRNDDLGD